MYPSPVVLQKRKGKKFCHGLGRGCQPVGHLTYNRVSCEITRSLVGLHVPEDTLGPPGRRTHGIRHKRQPSNDERHSPSPNVAYLCFCDSLRYTFQLNKKFFVDVVVP